MSSFRPLRACFFALLLAGCGAATSETALARQPESPIQRCMNLSNALEAPREGEWGYTVRGEHLALLAEAGFDTVRLPVKVSAYTQAEPPYRIDPALLMRMDEIVAEASVLGLNIIIDLHHYDEIHIDPDGHVPRLAAIWHQLATHYQGAPETVIFEVLNEPNSALNVDKTRELNAEMLSVIRQTNPDRWVILGSSGWGGLEAWLEMDFPEGDPRLISTFHYYEPYEFTHQGAAWIERPPPLGRSWGSREELRALWRHFDAASRHARAEGLPVLLGEFGVYREADPAMRAVWVAQVRQSAEQAGFGWCHWGFGMDFRAYDLDRKAWAPGYLQALGLEGGP